MGLLTRFSGRNSAEIQQKFCRNAQKCSRNRTRQRPGPLGTSKGSEAPHGIPQGTIEGIEGPPNQEGSSRSPWELPQGYSRKGPQVPAACPLGDPPGTPWTPTHFQIYLQILSCLVLEVIDTSVCSRGCPTVFIIQVIDSFILFLSCIYSGTKPKM